MGEDASPSPSSVVPLGHGPTAQSSHPLLAVAVLLAVASAARADVTLGTTTFPGSAVGGNTMPGHVALVVSSGKPPRKKK
jgi:hypothetical protein